MNHIPRELSYDPFFVCEQQGFHLFRADLPRCTFSVYYRLRQERVILLNEQLPPSPAAVVLDRMLGFYRQFPDNPYILFTAAPCFSFTTGDISPVLMPWMKNTIPLPDIKCDFLTNNNKTS